MATEKVLKATVADGQVQANMLESINKKVDTIIKAEKVTKKMLGEVSRELLTYITLNGSPDVGTVNRLIAGLTPINQKTAVLFFSEFIPHIVKDKVVFGGRIKGEKQVEEFVNKTKEFLADKDNNIWTWATENIKVTEVKPWADQVKGLVERAMNGNDKQEGIGADEILAAVMAGGISIATMFAVIDSMKAEEKKDNIVPIKDAA